MLILFVFSFTAVLGVRSETSCDDPPECQSDLGFQTNALKLGIAIEQMGNGLPSNKFFQENCDFLLEFFHCYQQGCGLRHLIIDLDAVISNFEEFCNEESDIRKAYVKHVDCFNTVQLTEESCVSSILSRAGSSILDYDVHESPMKNTVDRLCLLFHFAVVCVADTVTTTCGRAAGNAAADILNRVLDIAICNPSEIDLFDGVVSFLRENEHKGDLSAVGCSGSEEFLNMITTLDEFPLEDGLQQQCSLFQETLACPLDRVKESNDSSNRQNDAAYEGILEVLNALCDQSSDFRAAYLRSVPCYNNTADKFLTCIHSTKDLISHFMLDERYSPLPFGTNSPLKYSCMSIDLIPDCLIKVAADDCGAEAAMTMGKLLLKLKHLSLNMNCRQPHMAVWRDEFMTYLRDFPGRETRCEGELRSA